MAANDHHEGEKKVGGRGGGQLSRAPAARGPSTKVWTYVTASALLGPPSLLLPTPSPGVVGAARPPACDPTWSRARHGALAGPPPSRKQRRGRATLTLSRALFLTQNWLPEET